jgi:signal peptidase I
MADSANNTLTLTPIDFAELTDDILTQGSAVRFKARGQSMRPFIRDGDILTVAPVKTSMLRRSDVILYRAPAGNLVAHRVHSISRVNSKTMLTICGDAQLNSQETIHAHQVLGRVQNIERNGTITNITGVLPRMLSLFHFRLLKLYHLIHRTFKSRRTGTAAQV